MTQGEGEMGSSNDESKSMAAATKPSEEPEMWKYEDYKGRVEYFPKPPEKSWIDILDEDRGGDDEHLLTVDNDEVNRIELPDQPEEPLPPDTLTGDEKIMALARWHDRWLARKQLRRKIARARKKEEIMKWRAQNEYTERWNFPKDTEGWSEEALGEEWMEKPPGAVGLGYDPADLPRPAPEDFPRIKAELLKKHRARRKEWDKHLERVAAARKKVMENPPEELDPEFYNILERSRKKIEEERKNKQKRNYFVPYRKPYPLIPGIHPEVENAWDVVHELEKIEEFLRWGSYIFQDGSTYEGTVWDDLAHGKGVYKTIYEHVKYEGMWLRNMMEGHGVLHVNIPTYQPIPDSKLEKKMREEGWVITADFMDPEEREWLKKDIEDMLEKPDATMKESDLFHNDPFWLDFYGDYPEKGRYKYSGQWKLNRMHGCGVLDINTDLVYGKFYFGDLLPLREECDLETCALHSGIAQVAAAKARMFEKKPDGMVREMDGPWSDPQHPYMYEEEDLWMAPGWVNAFCEVPDEWKAYVEEVDKEQEMWLNSFIKAPLRVPMPAEQEYVWENDDEFVFISNEPSFYDLLDEEVASRWHPKFKQDIIYHIPTGRLINWTYDDSGSMKFYWQPMKEGEKPVFLNDGWEKFFSDDTGDDSRPLHELTREERERRFKREEQELERQLDREEEERKKNKPTWSGWLANLKEKLKQVDEEFDEEMRKFDEMEAREKALKEEAARMVAAEEEQRRSKEPERLKAEEESKEKIKPEVAEERTDDREEDEKKSPPSFGKVSKDEDDEDDEKPRQGSSFGKVSSGAGEDDEDEDDEDNKRPSSFGRVASAAAPEKRLKSSTGFPNAFAAITMSVAPWFSKAGFSSGKTKQRQQLASNESCGRAPGESFTGVVRVSCGGFGKKSFGSLRAFRGAENRSGFVVNKPDKRISRTEVSMKQFRRSKKGGEDEVFSIAIPVY